MSNLNNFDMDWNNLPDLDQGDVVTMKLKDGDNQVRICSKASQVATHWEKDVSGNNHKIICSETNTCPICQKGIKPTIRYQMLVIDRADGKVKVLECGKTIWSSIMKFAKDADYGNPTHYDIKINRTGTGFDTKYQVMPKPTKSPITPEEKELIAAHRTIADINKISTLEEIKAMNLECLAESMSDLADSETTEGGSDDDWDDI